MTITIRHPDGRELEVAEETFTEVFEAQGFERVSESEKLGALTRDELNGYAETLAIADPAHYPNKAALIEEIERKQAAVEQAADTADPASNELDAEVLAEIHDDRETGGEQLP